MKKQHILHQVTAHGVTIHYFYTKEKRDRNGNSRYRVFMIDTETNLIYERVFTTYESQIAAVIMHNIETTVYRPGAADYDGEELPF